MTKSPSLSLFTAGHVGCGSLLLSHLSRLVSVETCCCCSLPSALFSDGARAAFLIRRPARNHRENISVGQCDISRLDTWKKCAVLAKNPSPVHSPCHMDCVNCEMLRAWQLLRDTGVHSVERAEEPNDGPFNIRHCVNCSR